MWCITNPELSPFNNKKAMRLSMAFLLLTGPLILPSLRPEMIKSSQQSLQECTRTIPPGVHEGAQLPGNALCLLEGPMGNIPG
jgi:hypothetical protein